ncbi:TetR/AcrR family transcriptional regulator [Ancylomarina sp. 16SWW S1-10-2]|uniref:TetR/AcrR family transcriptional regulator n=1 Tax=Ancylomarina sp. 16SWW S1-10-2 TaxID=2499681 RepID=UPI0012AE39BA|nr:TetR/AcrR family transcriptional regulator [Ancylomarina sp. 16SWW S1-10-2]MRT92524.1 TetR/AcrR family transcriptional regulator [Ancylomarina sp. 16SWW S1-10-2]
MEKKSVETQENILIAARAIFAQKGLAGARMQEIADTAGINKALLHYYYKNKGKLFEQVFDEALKKLFRPMAVFMADDSELFQKIRNICKHYNEVLIDYPFIPNFVINEINSDPTRILKLLDFEGVLEGKKKTEFQINEAVKAGLIRSIDPRELILNVISMSIFPFAARPIIKELLYENEDLNKVLQARADQVADFIIQSIKL